MIYTAGLQFPWFWKRWSHWCSCRKDGRGPLGHPMQSSWSKTKCCQMLLLVNQTAFVNQGSTCMFHQNNRKDVSKTSWKSGRPHPSQVQECKTKSLRRQSLGYLLIQGCLGNRIPKFSHPGTQEVTATMVQGGLAPAGPWCHPYCAVFSGMYNARVTGLQGFHSYFRRQSSAQTKMCVRVTVSARSPWEDSA